MLSWQDAASVPIVHISDLARGIAYAVLPGRDGTFYVTPQGQCKPPCEAQQHDQPPSAPYCFSLRYSVAAPIPSFAAACVRLPPTARKTDLM